MSLPSRKTRRERLVSLLEATEDYQAVYDHQPKDFGGQSPVATVHDGPTDLGMFSASYNEVRMGFVVTNYVRRDAAATAEDQLDALLATVHQMVRDNVADSGYWDILEIGGPTEPDYYNIDGVQYRVERVPVTALVQSSG